MRLSKPLRIVRFNPLSRGMGPRVPCGQDFSIVIPSLLGRGSKTSETPGVTVTARQAEALHRSACARR